MRFCLPGLLRHVPTLQTAEARLVATMPNNSPPASWAITTKSTVGGVVVLNKNTERRVLNGTVNGVEATKKIIGALVIDNNDVQQNEILIKSLVPQGFRPRAAVRES